MVNSVHHQAVKNVGQDLRVAAHADDGVIEAIEHTDLPFCLGIQWHPEFILSTLDASIFKAFIHAASSSVGVSFI
jgi:putative glutamine amidotransferase